VREEDLTGRSAKYDLDFSAIHQSSRPTDIRDYDRVVARIRLRDLDHAFFNVKLWKMSPLGVEIVHPKDLLRQFEKGDAIDLELIISGQRMSFEGLVVDLVQQNENIKLIGIRLSRRVERSATEERRGSPRWLCSDHYFPTCVATSPFVLHEITNFQVRDISTDGMLLICSLDNSYLLPEMKLRLTVNFPMIGDFVAMVKVARVGFSSAGGKDMLAVGVEFLQMTANMKSVIAQYLIQFSNINSLDEIKSWGLNPTSLTKAINFYFIKSEEDYREVLSLRRIAHLADDNFEDTAVTDEDMGDIYDAESRILVGRYKDKIVTTARIRFNSLEEPLEHESHLKWPETLPRRDQIVEVSRAANHPEFRHSDLLIGLFQFIAATCIREEKPFFVIGSWAKMVSFYEKLGFTDTGLSHGEPLWKYPQHIMIADGMKGLLGKSVNPIYWNLVWRVVAEHMIESGILEPKGLDKVRFHLFKLLGPLATLVRKLRSNPRKNSPKQN
jgi:predicted GNAT family N-acyltransferase